MLVLRLLVLDLCEPLQIICLFYSLCIAVQPHTICRVNTDYSTNCISVKPVVPKYVRTVTLMKVAIMSYYP